MSPRAAEMARMLFEQLPRDCSEGEVQRFVIEHFANDTITDLEAAIELMGEFEVLEDIDRFVEQQGAA